MNDLVAIERIAQWEKLKGLVLDSVFPDYETRIQHGAERVHGVVSAGAAAGLHQGHS